MLNKKSLGFSLIELMTVVVIMVVISAYATPSYLTFLVRAKVTEAFTLISPCQHNIEKFAALNSYLPYSADLDNDCACNSAGVNCGTTTAGLSKYVKSIAYTSNTGNGVKANYAATTADTALITVTLQTINELREASNKTFILAVNPTAYNASSGGISWVCRATQTLPMTYMPIAFQTCI